MDKRWLDVEDQFQMAVKHLSKVDEIPEKLPNDEDGYFRDMALMHVIQSGYTSIENGIKNIFSMLDEEIPTGANWYLALLRRSAMKTPDRPPIFSNDFYRMLDDLRIFRHVAIHSYDGFSPARAELAKSAATVVSKRLMNELNLFREQIDPEFKDETL